MSNSTSLNVKSTPTRMPYGLNVNIPPTTTSPHSSSRPSSMLDSSASALFRITSATASTASAALRPSELRPPSSATASSQSDADFSAHIIHPRQYEASFKRRSWVDASLRDHFATVLQKLGDKKIPLKLRAQIAFAGVATLFELIYNLPVESFNALRDGWRWCKEGKLYRKTFNFKFSDFVQFHFGVTKQTIKTLFNLLTFRPFVDPRAFVQQLPSARDHNQIAPLFNNPDSRSVAQLHGACLAYAQLLEENQFAVDSPVRFTQLVGLLEKVNKAFRDAALDSENSATIQQGLSKIKGWFTSLSACPLPARLQDDLNRQMKDLISRCKLLARGDEQEGLSDDHKAVYNELRALLSALFRQFPEIKLGSAFNANLYLESCLPGSAAVDAVLERAKKILADVASLPRLPDSDRIIRVQLLSVYFEAAYPLLAYVLLYGSQKQKAAALALFKQEKPVSEPEAFWWFIRQSATPNYALAKEYLQKAASSADELLKNLRILQKRLPLESAFGPWHQPDRDFATSATVVESLRSSLPQSEGCKLWDAAAQVLQNNRQLVIQLRQQVQQKDDPQLYKWLQSRFNADGTLDRSFSFKRLSFPISPPWGPIPTQSVAKPSLSASIGSHSGPPSPELEPGGDPSKLSNSTSSLGGSAVNVDNTASIEANIEADEIENGLGGSAVEVTTATGVDNEMSQEKTKASQSTKRDEQMSPEGK